MVVVPAMETVPAMTVMAAALTPTALAYAEVRFARRLSSARHEKWAEEEDVTQLKRRPTFVSRAVSAGGGEAWGEDVEEATGDRWISVSWA